MNTPRFALCLALLAHTGCGRSEQKAVADAAPAAASVTKPSPQKQSAPITNFLAWVGQNCSDARGAAPNAKCYGKGEPDRGWCEGFCNGFVSDDAIICIVRYRETDPRAVRFDAQSVPGALSCADLGGVAVGKAAPDLVCMFATQPLKDMHVVINRRGGTTSTVFVMSSQYFALNQEVLPR
jgi:hypothetical protein